MNTLKKKCDIPDVRFSVCSVCGKKFGEVKKCYNVKCTNPFQTGEYKILNNL